MYKKNPQHSIGSKHYLNINQHSEKIASVLLSSLLSVRTIHDLPFTQLQIRSTADLQMEDFIEPAMGSTALLPKRTDVGNRLLAAKRILTPPGTQARCCAIKCLCHENQASSLDWSHHWTFRCTEWHPFRSLCVLEAVPVHLLWK